MAALLLRAACVGLSVFLCSAVPLTPSSSQLWHNRDALLLGASGVATGSHRASYNESIHRERRQLSEVVSAISSGARLLIGAGVGLLQSVGRLGKEVVGEADGGLLGLLGSLFTGVSVSLDLVRNVLLAVLGTKDILLGTPTKDGLTEVNQPFADSN